MSIQDIQPIDGFLVIPKRMTLNDPELQTPASA